MGNHSSSVSRPVYPLHPPLGLFHNGRYVTCQETFIICDEKALSISGNDFSITDMNKQPLFRVSGSVVTVNDRITLFDNAGVPICSLMTRILGILPTGHIYDPSGIHRLVTLQELDYSCCGRSPEIGVFLYRAPLPTFNDPTDVSYLQPSFIITPVYAGAYFRRRSGFVVRVAANNAVIAYVSRELGIRFGDMYRIHIGAGVDMALISVITAYMDLKDEKRQRMPLSAGVATGTHHGHHSRRHGHRRGRQPGTIVGIPRIAGRSPVNVLFGHR